MANHVMPKFSTWTKETYIEPVNMTGHRYYSPNHFPSFGHTYDHGVGREKWFHDYRRSTVAEKTLRNGQLSMNPPPIRPTTFSDSPDRVLGARKLRREAILNRPNYHLVNRIPDRERDRAQIGSMVYEHRQQYRDESQTLYEHTVPFFHYPTEAQDQFLPRERSSRNYVGNYPTSRTAALEYTYDKERGPKHYQLWHKV
ncbi:protein FAM166C-like [Actinia tenebrosa]|uniref:Ciliary microtubule inner protein 2C n=1 Tax=Actinia tenebrosa TaxID=6105 RepID=A0A6P8IBS0_ACTTE|nr:protein FAM166C-like [Actinia tenebrosa]